MEFKKLEIKPDGNWFKRTFLSEQGKRTLVATGIGAVAGALFFYFSEGQHMVDLMVKDVLKSMLVGGFFGFFITNSPCARGRC